MVTVTVWAPVPRSLSEEDGFGAVGKGVDETAFSELTVTVTTDEASTDLGSSGLTVTVTVLGDSDPSPSWPSPGCTVFVTVLRSSVFVEGPELKAALKAVSNLAGASG